MRKRNYLSDKIKIHSILKEADVYNIINGRIGLDGQRNYGIGIDAFRWWTIISDNSDEDFI